MLEFGSFIEIQAKKQTWKSSDEKTNVYDLPELFLRPGGKFYSESPKTLFPHSVVSR